ncbi:MAG TPA: dihydrodipicolinate reductase C-terminal domain-containing protein [Pyrinomonadaceae bacterium]|nr:dihydrodipicolinate reductase C-terminal domain-containing protein [Pyrinomonadaceae bacterium]
MKIGLIGDGAMGQLVAKLAREHDHEVVVTLNSGDANRGSEQLSAQLSQCEVAIDFTVADAVRRNIELCMLSGVPLVEGTTGWRISHDDLDRMVEDADGALVYGANFSIGAQVFFRIAGRAAELFQNLESYDVFIEEAHHKRKADAPSGTAIKLGEIVANHLGREVPISSTRAGHIPGTHRVGFDSRADHITLEHVARSREGFAEGALMAAQWIAGRKGVYEFSEVFDEILSQDRSSV